MFEVRIHGRGGQGVVTAAEMLSLAAFDEGRYAQAFPSFGSERMGAPVVAFCRIDDHEIRTREPVDGARRADHPGPTLLHQVDVFGGCKQDGFILINTTKSFDELGLGEFVGGLSPRAAVDRAGVRARARAHRARRRERRAARRLRGAQRVDLTRRASSRAIRERFAGAVARATSRPRRPRMPGSRTSCGS